MTVLISPSCPTPIDDQVRSLLALEPGWYDGHGERISVWTVPAPPVESPEEILSRLVKDGALAPPALHRAVCAYALAHGKWRAAQDGLDENREKHVDSINSAVVRYLADAAKETP
jgi:hypothetical protein